MQTLSLARVIALLATLVEALATSLIGGSLPISVKQFITALMEKTRFSTLVPQKQAPTGLFNKDEDIACSSFKTEICGYVIVFIISFSK
jgi:hypothetical protein